MHRNKGFNQGLPKKALFGYPAWLILALLLPLASGTEFLSILLNEMSNIQNTTEQWFQRSGSLTTVICAIIEGLIMVRLHRQMRGEPTQETVAGFLTPEEIKYLNLLQWAALLLVVCGTIIWGYGDAIHATWL